ncbi:MAG: peptide/nickel transport system substrate-binding protein [Pseudonocardiales bacterium]|nr:peptide/nickel transport system substrate-binding protein [Pseudonocardiales bacterium]
MNSPVDRRSFLIGGAGALSLAALAACTSGSSSNSAATSGKTSSGPAKRGGTLVVGSLGSNKDTLDAHQSSTDMDQQRCQNLYDSLTYLEGTLPYHFKPALAESIEVGADAMTATVRLRPGVEFHNGKTVGAEDLIFTMQRILDPKNPGRAHTAFAAVDPSGMTKLDARTVRFAFKSPDAIFGKRWGSATTSILPVGFDPKHPVGTGPFKFKSFTPGSRSVFVRNPNYWIEGQPYLDELQIIDFADNTSRTAAVLSGQIQALDGVEPAVLGQLSSAQLETLITKSGFYQPITMRIDAKPFSDVRVRQAFRLMVDRPAMVTQAYSGYASIGNDMPDPADPGYPSLPQRHQDIAQAKSLLKAAGYEGMSVTLTTAPENGSLVNSAQVFAQQAKAAGVTVKVANLTPDAYDANFTNWPFTNGYWAAGIISTGYAGRFLAGGGINDSHWDDPAGTAIYQSLLKATDEAKQTELSGELLKRFYDLGPDIIHSFKQNIDAYSSKLTGFAPFNSNGWSLGAWRYRLVSYK